MLFPSLPRLLACRCQWIFSWLLASQLLPFACYGCCCCCCCSCCCIMRLCAFQLCACVAYQADGIEKCQELTSESYTQAPIERSRFLPPSSLSYYSHQPCYVTCTRSNAITNCLTGHRDGSLRASNCSYTGPPFIVKSLHPLRAMPTANTSLSHLPVPSR